MGLDFVELVIATEERFGIDIADEDAERIRTVGDLRRLVESKLKLSDENTCLSQRAFYRLRKSFSEKLQIPRHSFKPDIALEDIVPRRKRIQLWSELQSATGASVWPDLSRSSLLFRTLAAGTAAIAVASTFWLAMNDWGWIVCALNLLFTTILVGVASSYLTRSFRTDFHNRTVRSLAEFVVAKCPEALNLNKDVWTPERIELAVRHVVVDQLGVKESEVKDEATFVDDLGVC